MNIYKNLMFLQGHFIDPHMDDAHPEAPAPSATPRPAAAPADPAARRSLWTWFATAYPTAPERCSAGGRC